LLTLGEYARLGDIRTINMTIQANDYPSGLFRIDSMLSTDAIAEDFDTGDEDISSGEFYIRRGMGTMFSVQVFLVICMV